MENSILTQDQKELAVQLMKEYLNAENSHGTLRLQDDTELDKNRIELIENELRPLLISYLSGSIPLSEFKSQNDGINKRNEYWGFKGIKGQMFFNTVVNVAEDLEECDAELKAALEVPTSEDMAKSRIRTFNSYVNRLCENFVNAGGSKLRRPKVGSIPFFLSYFWQVMEPKIWPIYYTNGVNTMTDLNLWQPVEDSASNYITFKRIHEELGRLFSHESGQTFGLYEVEHVFWFKGGNPFSGDKAISTDTGSKDDRPPKTDKIETSTDRLPDSYVPPIISVLPRIPKRIITPRFVL